MQNTPRAHSRDYQEQNREAGLQRNLIIKKAAAQHKQSEAKQNPEMKRKKNSQQKLYTTAAPCASV